MVTRAFRSDSEQSKRLAIEYRANFQVPNSPPMWMRFLVSRLSDCDPAHDIGNSGGPLFDGQPSILGTVSSGPLWPVAIDVNEGSKAEIARFNKWVREKDLNDATVAKIKVLRTKMQAAALDKTHRLDADIDASWFYSFGQLQMTDDRRKLYFTRFTPDSLSVKNLSLFCRVDGLAHFTKSLEEFENPTEKDVPKGKVALLVRVYLEEVGDDFRGGLKLKIRSSTAAEESGTLEPPVGGRPIGEPLVWRLQPTAAGDSLPHAACKWSHGLCEWKSVEVMRSKGGWLKDDRKPHAVELIVRFEREADASPRHRWTEETFIFVAELVTPTPNEQNAPRIYKVVSSSDSSTSSFEQFPIGVDPMQQEIWQGPLAKLDGVDLDVSAVFAPATSVMRANLTRHQPNAPALQSASQPEPAALRHAGKIVQNVGG
jgi:hypothetical protein